MVLEIIETAIPDVKIVKARRFGDARGFFTESYSARRWQEAGINAQFIQDNESYSVAKGTVRGLHFQLPPAAQAKLVRVLRGAVLDVAVDIRKNSPTYGQHVAVELSAAGGEQLFIPRGFAHGFCTTEAETYVAYKVDAYYAPEHDSGILWNDPSIGIKWPVEAGEAVLSDKDMLHSTFLEFVSPF